MLGQGGYCPLNIGLAPNISAYRCREEHSAAFKIRQNAFPAGDLPQTPLRDLSMLPQAP